MGSKTADEVIASVDATLANWRSAFESSSPIKSKRAAGADGGGGKKSPLSPPWKDVEAYHRRLSTFNPVTYFAKPLALSPLVCAAFGWENTEEDIIKCCHPKCGATICIAFHPNLNKESRNGLCQKYLDMLVSSHTSTCPFRPFASRWSKAMHKYSIAEGGVCDKSKQCIDNIVPSKENNLENRIDKVRQGLGDSKAKYYVPPYFVSLSDKFLLFEDCSIDGSITTDHIHNGALQIRDKLHAIKCGESAVEVVVPDAVTTFCSEVHPPIDWDQFISKKGTMKGPYLLSAFGWSNCEESAGENTGIVVKCNMCQARARMTPTDAETPLRKRRRTDDSSECANLKLIDSHRVHCPYVSGFSFGPGQESDLPGWKVILSNLFKTPVP